MNVEYVQFSGHSSVSQIVRHILCIDFPPVLNNSTGTSSRPVALRSAV